MGPPKKPAAVPRLDWSGLDFLCDFSLLVFGRILLATFSLFFFYFSKMLVAFPFSPSGTPPPLSRRNRGLSFSSFELMRSTRGVRCFVSPSTDLGLARAAPLYCPISRTSDTLSCIICISFTSLSGHRLSFSPVRVSCSPLFLLHFPFCHFTALPFPFFLALAGPGPPLLSLPHTLSLFLLCYDLPKKV